MPGKCFSATDRNGSKPKVPKFRLYSAVKSLFSNSRGSTGTDRNRIESKLRIRRLGVQILLGALEKQRVGSDANPFVLGRGNAGQLSMWQGTCSVGHTQSQASVPPRQWFVQTGHVPQSCDVMLAVRYRQVPDWPWNNHPSLSPGSCSPASAHVDCVACCSGLFPDRPLPPDPCDRARLPAGESSRVLEAMMQPGPTGCHSGNCR